MAMWKFVITFAKIFSLIIPVYVLAPKHVLAQDFWTKVDTHCSRNATSENDLAKAIALTAADEYFLFGGHEIDLYGRLIHFGAVETEHEGYSPKERKLRTGDLGWWHVLKYWSTLVDWPNPQGFTDRRKLAEANAKALKQLHELLGVHAYKISNQGPISGASRATQDSQEVASMREFKDLSGRIFDRIELMSKMKGDDKLLLYLGHLWNLAKNPEASAKPFDWCNLDLCKANLSPERKQEIKDLITRLNKEIDFDVGNEALRELSFRSAISDTPWSAAFISYVVKKAVKSNGGGQKNSAFRYDAQHLYYIYNAFDTTIKELGTSSPSSSTSAPPAAWRSAVSSWLM